MIDFLRTKFLQTAEDALLKGDYGKALYHAYALYATATRFVKDEEAARISGDLVALVQRLIEADFEAIAQQRGLTVTPENKAALLQEHSTHYFRFTQLLTKPASEPIPEVPFRNKDRNEFLNYDSYKKIIKQYFI